ncbi:hypothetical protein [Mesoflavibacter zeaxanthinifaciens]|uniref:hypothetical protein n=1 Tax=Mesoflavibacter zeaxanthinifaciens TaxID=393060 RepID=UPI0026F1DE73|nr:hypothetical protein [Mesoflavibacter zeaxanthinifaciens]
MFENILDILKYPDYKQKAFNIDPYKTTAIKRAGNHDIIKSTISDIENNNISLKSFDRIRLVDIWKSETFSFSSKIIVTFWWGGLSHNNQAPLFYKSDNLNSLKLTSEILEQYFKNINTSKTKDELVAQLKDIYQALKFKNKKIDNHVIKISGINTSFFTKLFQFYFYTNPSEISNRFLPIIADKWSRIAVLADMMNNGYNYSSVFNIRNNKNELDVSFKHANTVKEYDVYILFLDYYNQRVENIKMINRYCNLDAFTLEEYIFGEGRKMYDTNNPRRIFTDSIINSK